MADPPEHPSALMERLFYAVSAAMLALLLTLGQVQSQVRSAGSLKTSLLLAAFALPVNLVVGVCVRERGVWRQRGWRGWALSVMLVVAAGSAIFAVVSYLDWLYSWSVVALVVGWAAA